MKSSTSCSFRSSSRLLLTAACLHFAAFAVAGGYTIQVGAFPTLAEAEALASSLSSDHTPVTIQTIFGTDAYPHKVCVGYFNIYADAISTKRQASATTVSQGFLRKIETAPPEVVQVPVREPFTLAGLTDPEPPDASLYWEAAGLTGPDSANGGSESVATLESDLLNDLTSSKANRLRMKLARKLYRVGEHTRSEDYLNEVRVLGTIPEQKMADFVAGHGALARKDRLQALARFRQVASDTTLPPSVRRRAMRLGAGVLHALKKHDEAWIAFSRVAEFAASQSEIDEARMQQAGLAFEMVKCQKGNWDEVRALCQSVISDTKSAHNTRATAHLMWAETFIEERRLSEALQEIERFRELYPDVPREFHTAGIWRGVLLAQLGRYDEARTALESVADASIPTAQQFAGLTPRARAAVWLVYVGLQTRNTSLADAWTAVIRNEFPGSREEQHLDQVLAAK